MKFKKILKRAAISISVLLLIFKSVLMYRDYTSYKDVIHKNANQIVKVRVDGIFQSIAFNAIKNPSYYLKKDSKKESEDDKKSDDKGVSVPANLFLYTLNNYSKTTVFTSFKISDSSAFKNFITSKFQFKNFKSSQTITTAFTKDKKMQIGFNAKQCVVVFSQNQEDVNLVFEDLLNNGITLDQSDQKWSKLKAATAHVNYITKNNNLNLDFKSGQLLINGNFILPEYLDVPKVIIASKFSSDASITLDLNAVSTVNYVSFKHKDFTVQTDSLSAYFKGYLGVELARKTTQIDSVITYQFNDDFEKVATQTAVEKEVPEINIQMSTQGTKLYKYLKQVGIINTNRISKDLFPLYQFNVDSTTNGLLLSTGDTRVFETKKIEPLKVLALTVDFKKLQEQNHFPIAFNYMDKLLTLKLNGISNHEETIDVSGEVNLKNKDINALAHFFINQKE